MRCCGECPAAAALLLPCYHPAALTSSLGCLCSAFAIAVNLSSCLAIPCTHHSTPLLTSAAPASHRMRLVEGEDGAAIGEVLPSEAAPVPFSEVPSAPSFPDIRLALEAELGASFDLDRPPFLRAVLLRHAAGDATLCLTMHHVVGDNWAVDVLLRELSALYNAAAAGTAAEGAAGFAAAAAAAGSSGTEAALPPLPIQYADWAAWQLEQLSGSTAQRDRKYWQQALLGCVPVLQLPLDRPRPALPKHPAGCLRQSLGSELMAAARMAARDLRVSLQAFMLAAVQVRAGWSASQDL